LRIGQDLFRLVNLLVGELQWRPLRGSGLDAFRHDLLQEL
jgi:hypothetical protein